MNDYIARFRVNDLEKQELKEHIKEVQKLAAAMGKRVDLRRTVSSKELHSDKKATLESTLSLAGLLHDFGKYSIKFQRFIHEEWRRAKENKEEYLTKRKQSGIDHGVYGAKYIYDLSGKYGPNGRIVGELLADVICYHHGGLPDAEDFNGDSPLLMRLQDENRLADYEQVKEVFFKDLQITEQEIEQLFKKSIEEIKLLILKSSTGNEAKNKRKNDANFMPNLFIKLIYSMLIDADRLSSMCYETGEDFASYEKAQDEIQMTWKAYKQKFEEYLSGLQKKSETLEDTGKKRVNAIRQRISDECFEAGRKESGIYTLTVPTGGGKTLSSMRYALEHSERTNKERIIFVLPYTTIIEQNAKVIREVLGENCDLLEHHSNVTEEDKRMLDSLGEERDYRLLTQRWENRIIFTTMVQFLNTFYGRGTKDMRRMHHLLNAVIIFDEIQTVPVKCMALFNGAINFLNRVGNTSTILCTATQPDFSNISKDISLENIKGELINAVEGNFTQLKRVEINNCCAMKPYTIENAASFIWEKKAQVNSLLVVVNKIKTAKDLFQYLKKNKEDVATQNIENAKGLLIQDTRLFLLTGDQCPEHKKDILDELLKALKKGEQVLCISTSLIEAGVDISFQAAIRNMTKLDSIVQTAGRVNRNGERDMGYCYVINLEEGSYEHMSEIRLGQKWSNVIFYKAEQEKKDILLPELMKEYFDDYYNDNECSGNFKYPIDEGRRSIYELLTLKRNQTAPKLNWKIQFKRAAENFKVIDADMTTVLVPYLEKGQELMRQIEDVTVYTSMAERKELLEKAKKYSLNINRYKFRQIYDAGGITFKEDMGVYLLNYAFYDEKEMGILLEADPDKYIM